MKITLVAVGQKMPGWISDGFQEYVKRLPAECSLRLVEIAALKRGKNADIDKIKQQESEHILAAIPKECLMVALDEQGQQFSTEQLAKKLDTWMLDGRNIALMIGGPDGLAASCLKQAQLTWSLSNLTLPHAMVRVIVAEQLYRAWSILRDHPYHRA